MKSQYLQHCTDSTESYCSSLALYSKASKKGGEHRYFFATAKIHSRRSIQTTDATKRFQTSHVFYFSARCFNFFFFCFKTPNWEGKTKPANTSWPKQLINETYVYVSMLRRNHCPSQSLALSSRRPPANMKRQNNQRRPKMSAVRAQNRLEVAEHKGHKTFGTRARRDTE